MPTYPRRVAAVALLAPLCAVTACTAPKTPSLSADDTVRAAQALLTDRCLTRQGLTPPRPGQSPSDSEEQRRVTDALFGTGRAELSLTLPSGHEIRQHTDGCLAQAQQRLYGDQERWFRASTTVNNLKNRAPAGERTAYRELRAHAVRTARTILQSAHEKGTSR
ncbi:hypothetical protein H0H10_22810 [Streptomyces sp. TRM S81-3]|uniref:Lipoprotein n=1 Tax=Streptomyces griseicoloratus TaxID=2752516 RepID=A0A926L3T0_9ACTN|nr:hypothetical protein [Streptomyces griseicoloratus]MBD0421948.1 hypothetical protein [Streptomyces griseicoloratus]